ncbi:MAG TPA: hypothetical protein VJ986_09110 [Gaiellaceae bacterium]|nr:hypothetical protein [Gaiellaceae bacterium]
MSHASDLISDDILAYLEAHEHKSMLPTWVNPWFPHEPPPSSRSWRSAPALRRERGLASAGVRPILHETVKGGRR